MSVFQQLMALAILGVSFFGCVGPVKHEITTDYPAAVLHPVRTPSVIDGRARFREIFCKILVAEPDYQDTTGACERFLLRLNDEPLPINAPQQLPNKRKRYRIMIVPGFLNECFAKIALPFEDAISELNERGLTIDVLLVSGLSSSDANAAYIAEMIGGLNLDEDERLILVGHSKGVVDILHFLVNHPDESRKVAAVVSVAGAINGSPLTAHMEDIYFDVARNFFSGRCETEDDGALQSLRPAVRMSWLAANPLPESAHYFSLAAFTKHENINTILKTGYDLLWIYSPRNDGMLLSTDQIIPGGTFLGYANADHWSVVLPLENRDLLISETVQATERFPRRVLLEALLVYVAEALEQS